MAVEEWPALTVSFSPDFGLVVEVVVRLENRFDVYPSLSAVGNL